MTTDQQVHDLRAGYARACCGSDGSVPRRVHDLLHHATLLRQTAAGMKQADGAPLRIEAAQCEDRAEILLGRGDWGR